MRNETDRLINTKRKILVQGPFREGDIEKMQHAITEDFSLVHISDFATKEELSYELKDAEVVVGQPSVELLKNEEKCPKLKFVQMVWAGTDRYTAPGIEFPKDRILLANGSGAYGMIMSQFAIGMTLSVMLNFKYYHRQQQDKIWDRGGPIRSLDRARVLIFGAGDIGTFIAKRLVGFDAYCIGVCRDTAKKRAYFHELCILDEAEKYLPDVDVVIGCIPNSKETAGYLNRQRLSLMKADAVVVNIGRGNLIDCMALDEILRKGDLWGAALDVTDPEPLPTDHPLWNNPRCMITPHTSGTTFGQLEATENLLCDIICENLSRYCSGSAIKNRIVFD